MKSLRTHCQVLTVIFVAIVVVSSIAALSGLTYVQHVRELSPERSVDEGVTEAIELRQGLIALLQLALFLACSIAFLMWFYRAHKNLKTAGPGDLRYKSGWTVGGFVVPFLNLVRPYQVMKEVWAATTFQLEAEAESARSGTPPPLAGWGWAKDSAAPLVQWWWALFLLMTISGNVAGRMMARAEDPGELLAAAWLLLIADLADIPAAIAALVLVRRITEMQQEVRDRLRARENPVSV